MKRKALTLLFLLWSPGASVLADTLFDLYQQAKTADPQFKITQAEYDAVAERRNQARADLLPGVGLGADYNKVWGGADSEDNTNHNYSLSLTQPLYKPNARLGLSSADLEIEKVKADLQTAEQDLMIRTASSYFGVLSARDGLRYAQNNKNAIRKQLEQSQQRYDVGLIAITDVRESQAGYDLATADEIQAQNTLNNSHEDLREITGVYRNTEDLAILGDKLALLIPEPENIDEWTETGLAQSPLLTAAQHQLEIAGLAIKRARTGHLPVVNLTGRHNVQRIDSDNFDRHNRVTSIGVELSMALDAGGKVRSGIREAQIRYTQALDGLERQRRATQKQIHAAYLNVISGISRVKALKQAVFSTQTAYEATATGFDVGTRTSVEVLNSQREVLRAQRDYARARYDYVLNTLRLKQAAGLLAEADLEKLNPWFQ
ncbi:MAG: TolC family outer membrane protein [Gammaproteobacteria bacterium]|nr:TolC family outer membrane protein [Gammaproteobacteria bacterium]